MNQDTSETLYEKINYLSLVNIDKFFHNITRSIYYRILNELNDNEVYVGVTYATNSDYYQSNFVFDLFEENYINLNKIYNYDCRLFENLQLDFDINKLQSKGLNEKLDIKVKKIKNNLKMDMKIKVPYVYLFLKKNKKINLYKKNSKRYYFLNNKFLNLNKFKHFKNSYKELNNELKFFTKSKLKHHKEASSIFGIAGFLSLFLGPKISVLGHCIYLIATFEFFMAIMLLFYIVFEQLKFIYKYDLNCNSKTFVKIVLGLIKMVGPYASVVAKASCIGFGWMLSVNWFVENTFSVNILKEVGINYIDGDKSISETSSIIVKKIKNGYKELY